MKNVFCKNLIGLDLITIKFCCLIGTSQREKGLVILCSRYLPGNVMCLLCLSFICSTINRNITMYITKTTMFFSGFAHYYSFTGKITRILLYGLFAE